MEDLNPGLTVLSPIWGLAMDSKALPPDLGINGFSHLLGLTSNVPFSERSPLTTASHLRLQHCTLFTSKTELSLYLGTDCLWAGCLPPFLTRVPPRAIRVHGVWYPSDKCLCSE